MDSEFIAYVGDWKKKKKKKKKEKKRKEIKFHF